jgi:DNA repair protein RecO (recombination protein O)
MPAPSITASGIILRTRPLTETSLIVHWITSDLGRMSTVAKGARRAKSPFRGKLDLFYQADFSFQRSRRSELHLLREASLRTTHPALRRDLDYLRQAAYAAALVEQTTETETPLDGIFELFRDLLTQLPANPANPLTVLSFELCLLERLGQSPDFAASRLSAGSVELAQSLCGQGAPLDSQPGVEQLRELRRFLHGFLTQHLGRVPSSRTPALLTPA